jgi:hypothetical protein
MNDNTYYLIKRLCDEYHVPFKLNRENLPNKNTISELKGSVVWWKVYSPLYTEVSEEFIRLFSDKICWTNITFYQVISENLVRDYHDKVCWANVCGDRYKLSESFVEDFSEKIYWPNIFRYHKISKQLMKKHIEQALKYKDLIIKSEIYSPSFLKEMGIL